MRRDAPWALVAPALLLWALREPLRAASAGLWGPEDPWRSGDLALAWWWWWAASRRAEGEDWLARVQWPEGTASLAPVMPNPLDLSLLGALTPPTPLAWNLVLLAHLLGLVVATRALARALGASAAASAAGAALVATSPLMLHELAGGRPTTLIAWPGVLALAALARGGAARGALAGLLAALQAMAYPFQGLTLALLALPLLRERRATLAAAAVGLVAVAPYALWLARGLDGLPRDVPDAGYTALPLAGALGLEVPERFCLHPALLPAAALLGRGRVALAAALGLLVAVGPTIAWTPGQPLAAGPLAWAAWLWPPLGRMHHPLRAALLAAPLLAAALALGVDRLGPRARAAALALLLLAAAAGAPALTRTFAWGSPPEPPFAEDARALPLPPGPVVDLLGMPHQVALTLQPLHRRPLLEPLWSRRPPGALQQGAEDLSRGIDPGASFFRDLDEAGFVGVLVWDRFGEGAAARALVERHLGPPVAPGVYAL